MANNSQHSSLWPRRCCCIVVVASSASSTSSTSLLPLPWRPSRSLTLSLLQAHRTDEETTLCQYVVRGCPGKLRWCIRENQSCAWEERKRFNKQNVDCGGLHMDPSRKEWCDEYHLVRRFLGNLPLVVVRRRSFVHGEVVAMRNTSCLFGIVTPRAADAP